MVLSNTCNIFCVYCHRYIHGDVTDITERVPFTTGAVMIEGRTPAPELIEVKNIPGIYVWSSFADSCVSFDGRRSGGAVFVQLGMFPHNRVATYMWCEPDGKF